MDDLIKFLRTSTSSAYNKTAADRIEELIKELDISRMASVVMDNTVEELEAKLSKAVEALKSLHHAVCGKNGFAAVVRNHSEKAYPWEPLAIADEQTRAVLAELEKTNA